MNEDEKLKAARADFASLGRVDHKLALTEAINLQRVLHLLLPRLLSRIGTNHGNQGQSTNSPLLLSVYQKTHELLVSMLSHIMKRIREDPACKLPCSAILNLLLTREGSSTIYRSSIDPFTLNLAMAFLTLGIPRAGLEEAEELLPDLLILLAAHSGPSSLKSASTKLQANQVAHIILRLLERVVLNNASISLSSSRPSSRSTLAGSKSSTESLSSTPPFMDQTRNLLSTDPTASQALYDLLLDALLYQSSPSPTMPPPGLSQAGNERLRAGSSVIAKNWADEMAATGRLRDLKLAILDLVAPSRRWALFMNRNNPQGVCRSIALLVVTSGDRHSDVAARADSYLKLYLDAERSNADDDERSLSTRGTISIIIGLLKLVLGESIADVALSKLEEASVAPTLGSNYGTSSLPHEYDHVLSLKRRMTSEMTSARILQFCTKLLDETPQVLLDLPDALAVGTLSSSAFSRLLSGYTSGLSLNRALSYMAASKLLNAFCTRLTSSPTVLSNLNILDILSSALVSSCSVLSNSSLSFSSTSGASTSGEGSTAVRDACYGAVCSLSRCAEFCESGRIFDWHTSTPESIKSVETANLLFRCAAHEEEVLRPRAVAALDALLGAYCKMYVRDVIDHGSSQKTENPWIIPSQASVKGSEAISSRQAVAKALLPLLWNAAHPSKAKASRLAAATWAGKLLKTLDEPKGCHLLCCLAGDEDLTTVAVAREGLGLHAQLGEPHEPSSDVSLPAFPEIARVLFVSTNDSATSWRPSYFEMSYRGKAAAIRFGLNCLLSDVYNTDETTVRLYVSALCETFRQFGSLSIGKVTVYGKDSLDLLDECSICLSGCLSSSGYARSMIVREETVYGVEDARFLAMNSPSSKARMYVSESVARLCDDYNLWLSEDSESPFEQWIKSCNLVECLNTCATKLKGIASVKSMTVEVHGAAFLGAWSVRSFRLRAAQELRQKSERDVEDCWMLSSKILAFLGCGAAHADDIVGRALTDSVGIALSYDTVDAPVLDSRIHDGIHAVLLNLSGALQKCLNGDHVSPIRASLLLKAIGTGLASSTPASGQVYGTPNIGEARLESLNAIFAAIGSTAFRQDPEIGLLAGEALGAYADAFSPENAVWSAQPDSWPVDFSEIVFRSMAPHEQVLYALLARDIQSANHHKRTAVAPALMAIVARAARVANLNSKHMNRAMIKEIVKMLPEVQRAFIGLLADPKCKQLCRESCCLGLAACQGLAVAVSTRSIETPGFQGRLDDAMNDSLLKAFGQTTSFSGSAMMENQTQNAERIRRENVDGRLGRNVTFTAEEFGMESTEVGGAAGLGEAALGAYREMAGAALVLGRPDVLYALLLLSISHPVWFTGHAKDRYSASAILGKTSLLGDRTNTIEIRNALRPQIGKLVPRLLRAKHDPNKQTREQMELLWVGLCGGGAEGRQVITENLLPTIDTLIEDAQSKLWRTRVGSCGALAEAIVARSWNELGGGDACMEDDEVLAKTKTFNTSAAVRLLRLWRVAMRALDDVREAVRESGEILARSVKGLTIRLCDPNMTMRSLNSDVITDDHDALAEKQAQAASSTALRYLVTNGLNQKFPEAAGVSVSCLTGIVEVVRPSTLEPVLPELIGALLMAISGLEPAAYNYFQVRAAGNGSSESYDQLEQARIQFAQNGPISQALNRCLEMVPLIDLRIQQLIIPQLDASLRGGAGFATRAATADAVSSLCHSCPSAFKFSGTSSANPTVRLLRALYFASERERGAAAKDKMSHALGNLASVCPGQTVRSLVVKACDRYNSAIGSNDDSTVRRAASAAVRSIVVRAPNQISDGGPHNVWRRKVLPVAFLGRKDSDSKVASLWNEVWIEGGTSLGVERDIDFGPLVEERILLGLVRACVDALNDVAWARRVAGATSLSELCDLNVLAPIKRSQVDSPSNHVQSEYHRDKRRSKSACMALKSCVEVLVKPRVWNGKIEVLKTTVKIATIWASIDDFSPVFHGVSGREACPWLPIVMGRRSKSNDLFEGDNFFEKHSQDAAINEGNTDTTNQEIDADNKGESVLDFSEGDRLLAETNPDSSEEASGESEPATVSFIGLCRALVNQALPQPNSKALTLWQDEMLPFKAAALEGAANLLKAVQVTKNPRSSELLEELFLLLGPDLLAFIDSEGLLIDQSQHLRCQPPLIMARATECFSALIWEGIGESGASNQDVNKIAKVFENVGGDKQGAWTVREAALHGTANLASMCPVITLRNHQLLSRIVTFASTALQDRKFWRVRVAGLTVIKSLVSRAGVGSSNNLCSNPKLTMTTAEVSQQMMLEALLPFKEDILKTARGALQDSQSEVTVMASDVCGLISWWI